jgi:Peptidase family M13
VEDDGKTDDEVYDMDAQRCVTLLRDTIPFGVGYLYVRSIPRAEREAVRDDVRQQTDLVIATFLEEMLGTLDWMTPASKETAIQKGQSIVKNIGWPYWYDEHFENTTSLDLYHRWYAVDSTLATTIDYFELRMALIAALQRTEVGERHITPCSFVSLDTDLFNPSSFIALRH